eukprot:scaffold704_cov254-Pinguiococcus_pyrenoidosus.AAC.2
MSLQEPRGTHPHSPHQVLGRNAVSRRFRHLNFHFIGSVGIKLATDDTLAFTGRLRAAAECHWLSHSEVGYAIIEGHLASLP